MATSVFGRLFALLRRFVPSFPTSTTQRMSTVRRSLGATNRGRTARAVASKPAALFMILGLLGSMAIVTAAPADAALVRAFTRRFGVKTTGDVVMIANSVLTCPGACTTTQDGTATGAATNNNGVNMVFVDADGAAASPLAAGGTIATFDSSSSSYTLPAGAKVLFAGLYWGGDSSAGTNGAVAPNAAARNTVLLRYPGQTGYTPLTSNISGAAGSIDIENGSGNEYHAFNDITALVSVNPTGTYTVANLQAGTGQDREGGWAIVFVVEDTTLPARDLTVFDGFASVTTTDPTVTVTINGLQTPPTGIVNTSIGAVVYEGDRNTTGDNMKLNGTTLSNSLNPATNFFNSSRTTIDSAGNPVQMAGTPNYVNNLGYDADIVTANGILGNNATSATVVFNTTGDFFYPGVLTFVTELYAPKLDAVKTGVDVNGGFLEPGDIIEYTIDVTNNGKDPSTDTVLTDAIPAGTIYVPGSLQISAGANAGAKTDAAADDQANYNSGTNDIVFRLGTGANATLGGSMAVLDTTQVKFRVTVDPAIANGTSITNKAKLAYKGQTIGGGTILSAASNGVATSVTLKADLSLTKSHTGNFAAGSTGIYTFTVSNSGPNDAAGPITVTDTLPAGMSYVASSATNGWTCSGSPLVCTNPALLANGATSSFQISILVGATTPQGSVVNSAVVASPTVDPVSANNTANDPTTLTRPVDIVVSKTDGATSAVPGSPLSYTVTVTNNGPLAATGVTVNDTIPSALTGVTWTCSATASSACAVASGSGNTLSTTADLIVGGKATYVINGTLNPATAGGTGTLVNTAVANAPGMSELTPADNSATDTDDVKPTADVRITKTDALTAAVPGTTVSYTVTVSSSGPSNVAGVAIADTVPSALTGVSWSCSNVGAAICGSASGIGNTIATTADLPANTSVTYTVTGTLNPTTPAGTATLINTATATNPATVIDPVTTNNSATDKDDVTPKADLVLTKTDGALNSAPGQPITYTIKLTNQGPSTVTGASLTDSIPAAILNPTWTCTASGAGSCATTSGTGNVFTLTTLAAGEIATVVITGTVDPDTPNGTGTLVNTATAVLPTGVTDPTPGPTTATDTNDVSPVADLALTKDDGLTAAVPGSPVTYSVTVTNAGPSTATSALLTDTVPSAITGVTWTCAATGAGAACSAASGSGNTISTPVTVRPGTSVKLTITGTLNPATAAGTGSLTNTANIAPPSGTNDPSLTNNVATDTDDVTPVVDLAITKARTAGATNPGGAIGYTITVTNAGPSTATAAVIGDAVPAAITGVTWTCAVAGAGASCSSVSGSGNGISLPVTLPKGTSATLTVNGTIAASTPGGPLDNTATVTAAAGTTDSTPANNSATAQSTVASYADLRIAKTRTSAAIPGSSLTYLVKATNDGPSPVTGATVTDAIPAILLGATWTCIGTALGVCPASGTGSISALVNLPTGASVEFTVTGTIDPASTGTLSNTASVAPPAGVTDPQTANNSATDNGPLTPSGDLSITKTNGAIASTPGTATTYTIRVANTGPSTATSASVIDTLPSALTNVTWTCTATVGSSCAVGSGATTLNTAVTLAGGGVATYVVTGTIDANATGTLVNSVKVVAPAVFTDVDNTNDAATDTDSLGRTADVSVTKTDGALSSVPGTAIRYTIVASNAGPSTATADVTDSLSAALTGATWTCTATPGSSCLAASGSGAITTKVTLLANGKATFIIDATIDPAATGDLVNAVSIVSEAGTLDPDSTNNSATDTNTLTPVADLVSTKTNGATTLVSGLSTTYTITVTNKGPSRATAASVIDSLPAALINASWSCAPTASSTCGNTSGLGSVNSTVDLAPNGVATFTVNATVDPAAPAGPLVNTVVATNAAGTTDPTPGDATATDTDTVTPQVDLTTVKTDGALTIVSGTSATYTITVSNAGPSTAIGTAITDVIPAALTGATWTCAASTGSGCSATNGTGDVAITADIAKAGKIVITVTAFLDPTTPAGKLTNSAIAKVGAGVTDTNPADNTGTDIDDVIPTTELHVTKTNSSTAVVPGTITTYVITVKNDGPSTLIGATFTDNVPFVLTNVTWTCSALSGSVCPAASGSGSINQVITLAAGGTLTYLITGTVPTTATGTLANTAAVTLPSGTVDPTPADLTATDSDPLTPTAEIVLNKTSPTGPAVSGLPLTYTITASNSGPSFATGVTVADAPPATLLNPTWTCSATAGSTCGVANGTGGFSQAVDIAVGGTVTFLLTATVDPAAGGTLTNTATVTYPPTLLDPTPGPTTSTDTRTIGRAADLLITKTDGSAEAVPGDLNTYTIVVENKGPSNVVGASIVDNVPAYLSGVSWTCVADSGASCSAASGTGNLAMTGDLQPNTKLTIKISGTIDPTAVGTLINSASVAAPADVLDLDPTSNSATDTSVLVPTVKLAVTKTDGSASSTPGGNVVYTVTVANTGLSAAIGAAVTDRLPTGLTGATWTCVVTPPAAPSACGAASGVGSINSTVSLAPNATATYIVRAQIDPSLRGSLTNIATVATPTGAREIDTTNNSATDTNTLAPVANLKLIKTNAATAVVPGLSTTYTITVSNAGPSAAIGAAIVDTVPTILTGVVWTCVSSSGSSCGTANGSGNIADIATFEPLGVLTYTVSGTVPGNATGRIANTASVTAPSDTTDPDGTNNAATDDDPLTPTADIALTKTAPAGPALAGVPITYTITATNQGPSFAAGIIVRDNPPTSLTNPTWTCSATAGSSCSAASGTGPLNEVTNVASGGSVTYLFTADFDANATGTLANTATVTYPSTLFDPTPGPTTATDSRDVAAAADLIVTKSNGVTEVVPGMPTTYTITVTNKGPSRATGASVVDALPAALTNASWTCTATASSTCATASGVGSINSTVDLASNGVATYLVTATLNPATSAGPLTNTVVATNAPGTGDPTPLDATASDTDTVTPKVDLTTTKTDGALTIVPGTSATYTITVSNAGPSTAVGTTITDTLPVALTGVTWTCTATTGSTCSATSGTGNVALTADIAKSGTITITVTALLDPTTPAGKLTNTASAGVAAGTTDTNPADNTGTDTNDVIPTTELHVTKTNSAVAVIPGTNTTYAIAVKNDGPSTLIGATLTDNMPFALTNVTWTCSAATGSACPAASGLGNINGVINLNAGGLLTYQITGRVSSTATGTLANTATVALPVGTVDPTPSDTTATDSDPLTPSAEIVLNKTAPTGAAVAGLPITYTITASNIGPSFAAGVTVIDAPPVALLNPTWTCSATPGSSCPVANGTGGFSQAVDIALGGTVTFLLTATVDPDSTGDIANTATVTYPSTLLDPTPGPTTASNTRKVGLVADLTITKTDGSTEVVPGDVNTYTIVVASKGPSKVLGAAIVDNVPAYLSNVTWSCVGDTGAACSAPSGTGNVAITGDFAPNTKLTITVSGIINPTAVGTLTNTASVTPPADVADLDPASNTATDSSVLVPTVKLAVTKTDGAASSVPGGNVVYTVTVTNSGPSASIGTAVTDSLPAGLTGGTWTCLVTPAATPSACGAGAGVGSINSTVSLAPNATATYTVRARIDANARGSITNSATAAPAAGTRELDATDNSASDTNSLTPVANLKLTKTNASVAVIPGTSTTYTITVSNAGPSAAIGATIVDAVPTMLTGVAWTCVASTGSSCGAGSGIGDLGDTATVAPLGVLTYIVSGNVPNDASGRIVNTASVVTPGDTTDPDGTNNAATDDDPLTPTADILLTKTAPAGPALAGLPMVYTITATNQGPSFAAGITVKDTPPATLSNATWTCAASPGSSCSAAAGTGSLNQVIDVAPYSSVTYLFTADLDPNASGTLANTATVTYPLTLIDPTPGPTTATDSRRVSLAADLVMTKTDNKTEVVPGKATTYTITVLNKGPARVNGASIIDTLPAVLKNPRWDCGASSGATCSILTGTGDIILKADLAPRSTVTITLVADVDPTAAAGELINVAKVENPADVIDPDPTNNVARDRTTLTPLVNLKATKTDNTDSVLAGTETTYVLSVVNTGISTAVNASVVDALPAYLTNATWSCVIDSSRSIPSPSSLPASAAAASSCGAATGTGSIDTKVTLATDAKAIYTLKALVSPAARGTLANSVKLTPVAGAVDTDPSDNQATDTNALTALADLSVTKTDGSAESAPGGVATYVITLSNAGPSTATGVSVNDPNAAPITNATWTCSATAPSVCPRTSGSGAINETTVVVAPNSPVVYRVLAKIDPAARGSIVNTVGVTAAEEDPNADNNSAVDTNALVPVADLSVTKTDNKLTVTPGRNVTYTIVAKNSGPSSVVGAVVGDVLPKGLGNAKWTCTAPSGSSCGSASGTADPLVNVNMMPGAEVTITVEAQVDAEAGDIVNTATIKAPADTRDPDLTNNSSDDADTAAPEFDLEITKTDNQDTATPGKKLTYIIEVINHGPSFARGAHVSDLFPAGLLDATWDCMGTCNGVTSLSSIDATVDLAPGGKAVFTVMGTVDPDATGELRNEASVSPGKGVDVNSGNDLAVDTDKLVPASDVAVTKTDGVDEVVAGERTEYTITVTNKGPSSAKGIGVFDKLPDGLIKAEWTCSATDKSVCMAPSGSGAIASTVDLRPDGVATFVVKVTVDPNFDTTKGDLVNTASAALSAGSIDTDPSNNEATDTDKIMIKADVKITKTHVGVVTAGKPVTYTITVSNDGPSGVHAAKVTDTLPEYLTGATWMCAAVAPAAKCLVATGNGNIDTVVDLAPKASATFTVTAMVDVDAPDDVENIATIELPSGAIDTNLANNMATDKAKNIRMADISITKDDFTPHAVQGRENEYEIVVSNTGPSSGMGVLINDRVPKGLSNVSWTCTASEGSTCSEASGNGDIKDVAVNVRPNGKVTFLLAATISKTQMGDMINTATATAPQSLIDPDLANNKATDRDVMWKEWLKNPPKKKTRGVKIEKGNPSIDSTVEEAIDAVLAFTGSDARSMAISGLFLSLGGFALLGAGKRRRRKASPSSCFK